MQKYTNWIFALLLGFVLTWSVAWILSQPKEPLALVSSATDASTSGQIFGAASGMIFALAIGASLCRYSTVRRFVLTQPREAILLFAAALVIVGKIGSLL